MTDKELDAVLARAEAATPGPWHATNQVRDDRVWQIEDVKHEDEICDLDNDERAEHNARFIAHARTDVPALVAEVRRLRGGLDQLRRAVGKGTFPVNPVDIESWFGEAAGYSPTEGGGA